MPRGYYIARNCDLSLRSAVIPGHWHQIQPIPQWLAVVAENRPVAAQVAQEVWGHALLLARRACLLEPAAGMSHRPLLQQALLVLADKCCPSWPPKLSTVPAWLAVGLVPDPVP